MLQPVLQLVNKQIFLRDTHHEFRAFDRAGRFAKRFTSRLCNAGRHVVGPLRVVVLAVCALRFAIGGHNETRARHLEEASALPF